MIQYICIYSFRETEAVKTEISEEKMLDRYKICVGLNDGDSDMQNFDTSKYIKVIEYVCKNNNMAFSLEKMRGGYCYENGKFTTENSLGITLINVTKQQADELASELCAMFNQESVLIFHDKIGAYYLADKI